MPSGIRGHGGYSVTAAEFGSLRVIETTHSPWHEPLQAMSAVVLRFDGEIAFVGAYRGICPIEKLQLLFLTDT